MPEELQSLLDRIQEDGVEKAQVQAKEIIANAKNKATKIVKEAETNAHETTTKAEQDAAAFGERARQSLAQAARDVILSVGQSLDRILSEVTTNTVADAISDDTLRQMVVKAMEAYCEQASTKSQVEFILNEKDMSAVTGFLMKKYQDKLGHGVELKSDNNILGGFMLSVNNGKVQHDFSSEAIADSMSQMVRPQLAEIVRNAARQDPS